MLDWGFLVAQSVKNLPSLWETWVQAPGWEDPLEKDTATHSNILAWRIPRTEEPGGLQSVGSQRVGHDRVTKHSIGLNRPSRCVSPPLLLSPVGTTLDLDLALYTCQDVRETCWQMKMPTPGTRPAGYKAWQERALLTP